MKYTLLNYYFFIVVTLYFARNTSTQPLKLIILSQGVTQVELCNNYSNLPFKKQGGKVANVTHKNQC